MKGKVFFITLIVLIALIPISLFLGAERLELGEVLISGTPSNLIFFKLRLPRVILAIIVGSALSTVGATLQAFFRNPLASPFTLGVSGGSAFGAALAIGTGLYSIMGIPALYFLSFLVALITMAVVYKLSTRDGIPDVTSILLVGIVANFFYSSLILLIQYLSEYTRTYQTVVWMMGTMDVVGLKRVLSAALIVVPGLLLLVSQAYKLNVITQGEEVAQSLGVDVPHLTKLVYFSSSILVGAVVSLAGPIGFVGLMVPHIVRMMVGQDMRYVLPISMLVGSILLLLADLVARMVLAPRELPVGIITSFTGALFFVYLLRKRKTFV